MDRCGLLYVALSAGLHSILIAHMAPAGAPGSEPVFKSAIKFSYVETAAALAGRGLINPGAAVGGSALAALRDVGQDQAGADSLVLKGTGEVLSGVTREELHPLFSPAAEISSEAVNRYRKLIEKILERESRLSYPHIAMESGREARLRIRFCVRGDGVLESVEVPSRCGGFDRELVAGLKKAAVRFPPFPEEIKCKRLTFCWPVSFDLH